MSEADVLAAVTGCLRVGDRVVVVYARIDFYTSTPEQWVGRHGAVTRVITRRAGPETYDVRLDAHATYRATPVNLFAVELVPEVSA